MDELEEALKWADRAEIQPNGYQFNFEAGPIKVLAAEVKRLTAELKKAKAEAFEEAADMSYEDCQDKAALLRKELGG